MKREIGNFKDFWEGIEKASSSCFEIVKIIEERLGLSSFDEVFSNLPEDLIIESPEKTLHTYELNYVYKKQFEGTNSNIVAVRYDERKMLLCLVVMVDRKKYYMVPIRQVCFFINRNKAMLELEEFISRL